MTATPLTLADFLLARVDEDEAAAQRRQALLDSLPDHERAAAETLRASLLGGPSWQVELGAPDPARVLAECEAKRAIVEQFRPGRIVLHDGTGVRAQTGEVDDPRGVDVLRALASVYADHPDFDPAWSMATEFAVGT